MRRPAWTDLNETDPAVTLVELLTYVADTLASYQDAIAAEQQLRRRRYTLVFGAVVLALFMWWRSSDGTNDD